MTQLERKKVIFFSFLKRIIITHYIHIIDIQNGCFVSKTADEVRE